VGLIDRIRSGSYRPDDDPPLAAAGIVSTLRAQAERIVQGEPPLVVARDALDQLARCDDATLVSLVADEPRSTGDERADALLAGVADYVLARRGLVPPRWTAAPNRFLDRFWFVSEVDGFRAIAIAQTPISFRRRGILWPERSLQRV
jgi:hypothetical protein